MRITSESTSTSIYFVSLNLLKRIIPNVSLYWFGVFMLKLYFLAVTLENITCILLTYQSLMLTPYKNPFFITPAMLLLV